MRRQSSSRRLRREGAFTFIARIVIFALRSPRRRVENVSSLASFVEERGGEGHNAWKILSGGRFLFFSRDINVTIASFFFKPNSFFSSGTKLAEGIGMNSERSTFIRFSKKQRYSYVASSSLGTMKFCSKDLPVIVCRFWT